MALHYYNPHRVRTVLIASQVNSTVVREVPLSVSPQLLGEIHIQYSIWIFEVTNIPPTYSNKYASELQHSWKACDDENTMMGKVLNEEGSIHNRTGKSTELYIVFLKALGCVALKRY